MTLSLLIYGFLIYLLYRLVFHFIIPIYKTTKQVKKGFREMQEQMRQGGHQPTKAEPESSKKSGPENLGEYIDFEEVK